MSTELRKTLWGINFGIALAHIGNYIYFPLLVSNLGVAYSGFWAGFVMFLTYVGRLASTFCYEGVSQRLGVRSGVIAGVAVEAFALLGMGFVHGIALYSVLAFFVGLGSGISFPGLKNILSTFPEADRPKAFSSFQMSCQLGAISGAMIGGLFVGVDMRILFSAVFALFAVYCLAAVFVIPADAAAATAEPGAPKAPLFSASVLKGLRLGGGGHYFILSSVFWLLSISFLVGIPLHMQEYVKGLPISMPFWITGITLLVLQYPVLRFMNKHLKPGQVMAVAFAAMTLAYLFFGAGRSALWVVVGCFVVVFGDILFTPSFDLWVTKQIPREGLARAMGSMHFFRSFGNMVGTLSAGALYDLARTTGIPGLNWYVIAVIAAGCAVFSLAGAKQKAPEELPVADLATAGQPA
ncbi:DHA1 family multidrug resistance protein-like MFS transporter [Kitasatospora sp. MAP12-15]|uniref:MFS transporter n=1 Tax=unclassified Kitasatospora TaxID=2633591 RepID=UPI002474DD2F|nr:MFS transporter [Kitasatospora sp. MAP12-44]MDH6111819.1 DHA1 family multidrug resistance protein-like MFS transporter [Kitasatospora sp. MAP12-44]